MEFVANAAKIVERMKNNPRDWRVEDLKVVAGHFGITWRHHGTSHVVFINGQGKVAPVPAAKPILAVYVRNFLKLLED
jgi:precorrin-6B methylase 2